MPHKTLLITRPFYENPTSYLFYWSSQIIDLAVARDFDVIDVTKEKVIRKEIEGRLKKTNPSLVVFNGHGSETEIFGHDNEPIIIANINEHLLKGKIVFTRSCLSAKKLGTSCIQKGVTAYIGYDEDFIFMYDTTSTSRPLEDKIAKLFLEPSNQAARSLVKGNSAGEANQSSKNQFLKNIVGLLSSESAKDESETVKYLIWDMKHQVCLGDQSARL